MRITLRYICSPLATSPSTAQSMSPVPRETTRSGGRADPVDLMAATPVQFPCPQVRATDPEQDDPALQGMLPPPRGAAPMRPLCQPPEVLTSTQTKVRRMAALCSYRLWAAPAAEVSMGR